jgi:carbon storage regulator
MLILTRKIGESIIANEEIVFRVLAIKGSQVTIGVAAPRNISVHREEVLERINYNKESNGNQAKEGIL